MKNDHIRLSMKVRWRKYSGYPYALNPNPVTKHSFEPERTVASPVYSYLYRLKWETFDRYEVT